MPATRLPDPAAGAPAAPRSARPRARHVDAWTANAWHWEEERTSGGAPQPVLTIFLAGAECPFHCVFCDLWRQTLEGPTPPGAIPAQIEKVLAVAGSLPRDAAVKLYNASNFFDDRAVPPQDDEAIAGLTAPFARVVVESHPRLVGPRCDALAAQLDGRLEVAMGLETAHTGALARLGKAMTLDDFDRAAARLAAAGAALRVFLLVPPPFVPRADVVAWVARSAAHARACGAAHISMIPLRDDARTEADLSLVEDALDHGAAAAPDCVVTVDLWDIDRLATCARCGPARVARLRHWNLTGRAAPRVACLTCTSPS